MSPIHIVSAQLYLISMPSIFKTLFLCHRRVRRAYLRLSRWRQTVRYTRQCVTLFVFRRTLHNSILSLSTKLPHVHRPFMSNSHPITTTVTTTTSSANFQLIFNNALKEYEKRTKKDLLSHPLAAELQTCNSPSAILAVLHKQVQGLDQSPSGDDRWTEWLDPTVNVLHTLSDILGEGVSLVSFMI